MYLHHHGLIHKMCTSAALADVHKYKVLQIQQY